MEVQMREREAFFERARKGIAKIDEDRDSEVQSMEEAEKNLAAGRSQGRPRSSGHRCQSFQTRRFVCGSRWRSCGNSCSVPQTSQQRHHSALREERISSHHRIRKSWSGWQTGKTTSTARSRQATPRKPRKWHVCRKSLPKPPGVCDQLVVSGVVRVDRSADVQPQRIRSRYGLRGVRLGEATHPGPSSKRRRNQRLRALQRSRDSDTESSDDAATMVTTHMDGSLTRHAGHRTADTQIEGS